MAKLTTYRGDATAPMQQKNAIIPHICNDLGHWGAGFTRSLDKKWPKAGKSYKEWYQNKETEGTTFKLGHVQFIIVQQGIYIANMIAQSGTIQQPSKWLPPIRYAALTISMYHVLRKAKEKTASIHCPKFGCGLAGGEWNVIESMIREIWIENKIDVYVYTQ